MRRSASSRRRQTCLTQFASQGDTNALYVPSLTRCFCAVRVRSPAFPHESHTSESLPGADRRNKELLVTARTRRRIIFSILVVALTLPVESVLLQAVTTSDPTTAANQ